MAKTVWKIVLFVALPLALLEVALALAGFTHFRPQWYGQAIRAAEKGRIDYVFVGSSRVGAAIDPHAFASALTPPGWATPGTGVNLGRGYSTMTEHYLGLRRLYATGGPRLRGARVFVEAPDGLPNRETFRDPWVHPDYPELIVPLLETRDLKDFWLASNTPFELKAQVTAARLSLAADHVPRLRQKVVSWAERKWERLFAAPAPVATADMSAAGGTMTDAASVERVRRITTKRAEAELAQQPDDTPDWSDTVLQEMAELVRAHDGELIVFSMPVSSVWQRPVRTPSSLRAKAAFREHAQRERLPLLQVPFAATDEDFPDLLHLRQSRRADFSRALSRAYQALAEPRSGRELAINH